MSEVAMKVWMRKFSAGLSASAQAMMSLSTARASPHTQLFFTVLAMVFTALKSPGEEMGKPTSMTSTPSSSRASAILYFLILCTSFHVSAYFSSGAGPAEIKKPAHRTGSIVLLSKGSKN